MWAQSITFHVKPGSEDEARRIHDEITALEEPGSGLVRSTMLQDKADPLALTAFVLFESEEAARRREQDPDRQAKMAGIQARMREMSAGPPEFTDYEVIGDFVP